MVTLPESVYPGEVITSDIINAILAQLKALQEGGQAGTQVVPDLLGTFLSDARALITQPASQLALGFAIDALGAAIDPIAAANARLIVLNQSPAANSRVAPNTPVNLIVSAATAGSQTGSPPTIIQAETATGTVATSFPVNGTMVLVGANFSANAAQNMVKFDGTPATVTVDPADPTRRLFVVVPTGILGAPVASTDPPKPGVIVTLQTPIGSPATLTITVDPPLSTQPKISTVTPPTQYEKEDITIVGVNFSASAQVLIRDVAATIVSATATQIVATVPDFADILPGSPVTASLKVIIPGGGEDTFTGTFRVRGSN